MVKKILLILLIVCTALSMAIGLTACGEKKGEDESTTAKLEYNLETDGDSQYYSVSWDLAGLYVKGVLMEEIIIPSEYKGLPVKEVKGNKEECVISLDKLELPNTITKFGWGGYGPTEFTEINFKGTPDEWACIEFNQLFHDGARMLFNGEELSEITLSVEKVSDRAFYGIPSLEKVTFTENVKEIGEEAFYNAENLCEVVLNEGLKEIGGYAFEDTALKSLTIPASVTKGRFVGDIQDLIFLGKTCEDLSLWGEVENLTISVDLLNCVGNNMHIDVANLIITAGEVTTLDESGTHYLKNLESISFPEEIININNNAFYVSEKIIGLSCSTELYNTILKNSYHKNLSENIENLTIISGNIPNKAFYQNTKLKTVTLKDEVEEIGNSAFSGCTNLVSVSMTDSVTSLGEAVFADCTSLKTVTLSKGFTEIKQNTFNSCTSLENLVIPSKVEMIGANAFNGCSSLTNISIPEGNGWVDMAFSNCTSLTTVNLPSTITSIYAFAFEDCTALKDINFNGTIEQWNNIIKGTDWNKNIGNYTIHCTNGDIAKDN